MKLTILGFASVLSCSALLSPLLVDTGRLAVPAQLDIGQHVATRAPQMDCGEDARERAGSLRTTKLLPGSDCHPAVLVRIVDAH